MPTFVIMFSLCSMTSFKKYINEIILFSLCSFLYFFMTTFCGIITYFFVPDLCNNIHLIVKSFLYLWILLWTNVDFFINSSETKYLYPFLQGYHICHTMSCKNRLNQFDLSIIFSPLKMDLSFHWLIRTVFIKFCIYISSELLNHCPMINFQAIHVFLPHFCTHDSDYSSQNSSSPVLEALSLNYLKVLPLICSGTRQ